MRFLLWKKYKIRYFSSLNKDEDNETNEDTKTNENTEINNDTKINDDAEADDDTKTIKNTKTNNDTEVDDDTKTIENTDSDKIKSAILVLDRSMRSTVARRVLRKSLPYHTK